MFIGLCVLGRVETFYDNSLGLCEEAELEAQMINLVPLSIRIPNVQYTLNPLLYKTLLSAVFSFLYVFQTWFF